MRGTFGWIITISYYISQQLGILTFSYDRATGKFYTSTIGTIYCALMTLDMIGLIIIILLYLDFNQIHFMNAELHVKIQESVSVIRIIGVVITIIRNWTKREEFMWDLNQLQQLREDFLRKWPVNPKAQRIFETTVIWKFICSLLWNVLFWLNCYWIAIIELSWCKYLGGLINIMTLCLNMVMNLYHIHITWINLMLTVINEEVDKILEMSQKLSQLQVAKEIGPGALITLCCKLSDDLDELALTQFAVQRLMGRVKEVCEFQGVCVLLNMYMDNVALMYLLYIILIKTDYITVNMNSWSTYVMPITLIIYGMDLIILYKDLLKTEDLFRTTAKLLRESELFPLPLDERLEQSVSLIFIYLIVLFFDNV